MKDLDFDNLFTYMSLIFAICIFITIFYGCVFANAMGGGGGRTGGSSQILENFFSEDKSDIKTQLLVHLKEFKDKSATSSEDKKQIEDILEKINSNSVSIEDLDALIKLLKDSVDEETDEDSSSKDSSSKESSKDSSKDSSSKDSSSKDSSSNKSKDTFKNDDNKTDSKNGSGTVTAKPVNK